MLFPSSQTSNSRLFVRVSDHVHSIAVNILVSGLISMNTYLRVYLRYTDSQISSELQMDHSVYTMNRTKALLRADDRLGTKYRFV